MHHAWAIKNKNPRVHKSNRASSESKRKPLLKTTWAAASELVYAESSAEEASSGGGIPQQPPPLHSSLSSSSSNERTEGSASHPNTRRYTLTEISDAIWACKQYIEDKDILLKSAVRIEGYAQAASLQSEIASAFANLQHLKAPEKEGMVAE